MTRIPEGRDARLIYTAGFIRSASRVPESPVGDHRHEVTSADNSGARADRLLLREALTNDHR